MDTKPWWQSKTIWGVVVALVAQVLKSSGVDISAESPQLIDGILNVISLIGTVLAIYGRVRASKLIKPKDDDTTVSGKPLYPLLLLGALCALALQGCTATQLAQTPAGAAIITNASNSVIDKGLNAGATSLDTGNPYLHALADGLRSVEGQVLTSDDVKNIAAKYGDPANAHKFKTLALDVWQIIQREATKIGWAAATELAAQGIQDGATNPAPASP